MKIKKYKSLFSPDKEIRADQYIIEILCKNKAKKLKKNLSIGFSSSPEWATYFKSQLKKCHSYLEKYHPDIIISVISKKFIYSLYPKWLDDEFQKEHDKTLNITNTIMETKDHERIIDSKGRQKKDLDLSKFDE